MQSVKQPIEIKCKFCGNVWKTKTQKLFVCCSSCQKKLNVEVGHIEYLQAQMVNVADFFNGTEPHDAHVKEYEKHKAEKPDLAEFFNGSDEPK